MSSALRKIAEQGASYLYRGEWADAFVRQVNEQGGRASLDVGTGWLPPMAVFAGRPVAGRRRHLSVEQYP